MSGPWIAALTALFLWWFSTGAILVVVRRVDHAGRHAAIGVTLAAVPLFVLGLWGFDRTLGATSPGAIYGSFLSALAIWGWIELAFLTGTITGPNVRPCPRGLPEWERFIRAWGTVAYHEMVLTAVLAGLWFHASAVQEPFGLWTFATLYAARVSAKLNLYLGVPKINTEFLPLALAHLVSHFRVSRPNWLFPLSVTALTLASGFWALHLLAADPGSATGYALVLSLTLLALVEHWLMVLPLPDARLWRWMLPAPPHQSARTEGHHDL